ncbi:acyltransferase family protein [Massilia puerhi]|uniref:acyltransferase family protein n=1 Tax=Massilia puerhi TaxID=2681550 RepID=UPI00135A203D|nr:acyltransferase family protein [Massilia puerhi]
MKSNSYPLRQRRDDIQGLRVVSALLVFSFHVFFSGVSGGVDVFFVVSGYFLASNAVKRDELRVLPPLLSFYRNFLLRVAPQAIVALLGILLLLLFLMSPMVWATNLRDIAASALYLENFRLINRGHDYLARSESLTVVQHFWAVSLIGQTYFVWPFIIKLNKLLMRWFIREPRKMLTLLVSVLTLASFCWCLYFTHTSPSSAYFDFFSRFWEFGCGVLLGIQSTKAQQMPRHAAVLSWLGLAALVSCGFLIGSTLAFPGYASVWPVAGALLFIRYGDPEKQLNPSWLLSRPRLANLGAISFGVYLWHWPLYVVFGNSTDHTGALPLMPGLGVLFLSIICAILSKKIVDWFFSHKLVSSSKTLVPLSFLSLLFLISSSSEFARREVNKKGRSWDAANMHSTGFVLPGPFSVRGDNASVYKSGCHQHGTGVEVKTCSFGRNDAARKIVLVGGSHSTHWLPALVLHAEKEDWQVISITKSGCLFGDPADEEIFRNAHTSCRTWNLAAIREITALKPDLVVTLATRSVYYPQGRTEYVPEGYLSYFRQLKANAIPALALRDNPWMGKDIPMCVYSPIVTDKDICGQDRHQVLHDDAYFEAIKILPSNVRVADLSSQFCDDIRCWAVKDGIAIYRDSNHMTASYAERISPALRDAVNNALFHADTEPKAKP